MYKVDDRGIFFAPEITAEILIPPAAVRYHPSQISSFPNTLGAAEQEDIARRIIEQQPRIQFPVEHQWVGVSVRFLNRQVMAEVGDLDEDLPKWWKKFTYRIIPSTKPKRPALSLNYLSPLGLCWATEGEMVVCLHYISMIERGLLHRVDLPEEGTILFPTKFLIQMLNARGCIKYEFRKALNQ